MSRWLVIGAGSFTGKHFGRYLIGQGHEVDGISMRGKDVPEGWDLVPFDYVVNFAAANVVAPSWQHPRNYMDVNVTQQIRLWNNLREIWPKRYIHISTPEVYGSTRGYVNEDRYFNPSTPYAVSRAAAEMMLQCYFKQYGFPMVITRSCNVYGPGQQLYRLIPKLIACCKKGVKFPLEGNGHSTRSFLHVSDVCAAIYRVANQGQVGQSYHISSQLSWSIAGFAQMICKMMGKDPAEVLEPVPERPGKDADYRLNDSRIRQLGWADTVDMETGVAGVIKWMDDNWEEVRQWPMEYKP